MRDLRSDGCPRSASAGRVKAASRASGSAKALALTRPADADNNPIIRSTLTLKTVAEEPAKRASRKMHPDAPRGTLALRDSPSGFLRVRA